MARGCVCGGTAPLAAMSIRDMVRSKVLSPGKLMVLRTVALKPNRLVPVLVGLERTDVVKWSEVALFGSMQGAPLVEKDGGLLLSAMQ